MEVEAVSISMEAAGTSMNRVKQPGQCSGCFCSGRKKGPTVRGGRLVPMALPVRTAKVWLPAANLQYGTDSGAAAVVHSIAAYHSGTYIGEAHAGLRQINLGSLCSGGSTAAAAAVDIVHGGSVADTGDIPSRDQCGVDRVDGDPRAADLADAAGRNGYMKLCIGAVAVAAAITAAVAAIVAATGAGAAVIAAGASAGAAGVGSTAGTAAGTGTGRTGAAAASAGAGTATGVGAAAVAAAGRTSIAGAPDAGAGIAGIIGTCHIQSKPPIQWFAPSYSAGGKSVRDFCREKIKAQGIAPGGSGPDCTAGRDPGREGEGSDPARKKILRKGEKLFLENPRETPGMKKNIPDRPPEKARSDAVFAEAAKKAEKLSKKVLTSGNRIDIINKQSAMTHKNKSEMLLWLSRQSTSLVRTRSPVRIWLAAP